MYVCMYVGGVIVIIVGNEHSEVNSNPYLHFT